MSLFLIDEEDNNVQNKNGSAHCSHLQEQIRASEAENVKTSGTHFTSSASSNNVSSSSNWCYDFPPIQQQRRRWTSTITKKKDELEGIPLELWDFQPSPSLHCRISPLPHYPTVDLPLEEMKDELLVPDLNLRFPCSKEEGDLGPNHERIEHVPSCSFLEPRTESCLHDLSLSSHPHDSLQFSCLLDPREYDLKEDEQEKPH